MLKVESKTGATVGATIATLLLSTPFLMGSKGANLPLPDSLNVAAFPAGTLKFVPQMMVNGDTTVLCGVYASEVKGLEQISKLALTAKGDEGWLFIPSKSLWLEIPVFSGSQSESFASAMTEYVRAGESRFLFCYLHGNLPIYEQIKDTLKQQIPRDYESASKEGMQRVLGKIDEIVLPVTAMPNAEEIRNALLNVIYSKELIHEFKIVSKYGVTSFELDREQIRTDLAGADNAAIEEISTTLREALGRSYNVWSNGLIANILRDANYRFDPASINDIFEAFANVPYIRFKFEPRP